MIYILISLVSFLFAFLAYRYEKLVIKNNEILENYNDKLENELLKRTADLEEQKTLLEDSEFRWKFAVHGNGDGLWDWNINTGEVYFSKKWKGMLGFKENEIKNNLKEWEKRVHPDDLEQVLSDISSHLEGKTQTYQNEHRILCKDGTFKWILDRGIIVKRDKENKPLRLIGTHSDISQRKKLEHITLEQKEEFETIFKTIKDGIAIINLDAVFVNCNKAFLDLLGYTKDELFTKACSELIIPEDRTKNENAIQEAIKIGFVENMEKRCITKSGKHIIVHTSIALLPDKEHLLLSIRDVNTIKLLEEQSKMASMGEMIGNIAHQWRQPLSVISTNASGMKVQSDFGIKLSEEDISNFSDVIVKQTQYLSNTIDNFRDFLKGNNKYSKIDLKDTFEYTFSLIEASIENNFIKIIDDINTNLYINGSKNELSEAFINIINNSKDALKSNIQNEDDRLIFIKAKEIKNNKIEISFKDSGGGISTNIIDRIFEPYFTSKHKSIGTGLGLTMVNKIVNERHKGIITVYNEEFEYNEKNYTGFCFKIVFDKKD